MLPLIPFALGLLTGAAAVRLLKSNQAKAGLDQVRAGADKAQEYAREAAVSGLAAIESCSAHLRSRLSPKAEAPKAGGAPPEAPAATPVRGAAPAAKPTPRRKAAAPRKRSAKTAKGKEQTS